MSATVNAIKGVIGYAERALMAMAAMLHMRSQMLTLPVVVSGATGTGGTGAMSGSGSAPPPAAPSNNHVLPWVNSTVAVVPMPLSQPHQPPMVTPTPAPLAPAVVPAVPATPSAPATPVRPTVSRPPVTLPGGTTLDSIAGSPNLAVLRSAPVVMVLAAGHPTVDAVPGGVADQTTTAPVLKWCSDAYGNVELIEIGEECSTGSETGIT